MLERLGDFDRLLITTRLVVHQIDLNFRRWPHETGDVLRLL
jgi:hypothetical protein